MPATSRRWRTRCWPPAAITAGRAGARNAARRRLPRWPRPPPSAASLLPALRSPTSPPGPRQPGRWGRARGAPERPGCAPRPAGGAGQRTCPGPAACLEAKRSESNRNFRRFLMTTTTVTPADAAPGDGVRGDGSGPAAARCKRAGCRPPPPPAERGRSRQFCSDECRRRHYNALRGTAGVPAPEPAPDGPGAVLGHLAQLLAEASRLTARAAAQVAESDPERTAAVVAEAEAARRRAE